MINSNYLRVTNKLLRTAISGALLLFVHSNIHAGAAPTKLVIGYASTTPRLMPLWMARDQGFFAKYGIESEPVLLRSGATLVTGMASGDIQIGRTAGAAVLSAVAAGHQPALPEHRDVGRPRNGERTIGQG